MKNAIYFSTFLREDSSICWRLMQLHYALRTLAKIKQRDFDTIVFLDAPDVDFMLLKSLYPWVIIKKFNFKADECLHHHAFHKWWNLLEFAKLNYEKILYLDNDIYVRRDPSYIFAKYDNKAVYTIFDTKSSDGKPLLRNKDNQPIIENGEVYDLPQLFGFRGINSGQMLFTKKHISKVKKELTALIVENYKSMVSTVDAMIDSGTLHPGAHRIVAWVGEQYAGHKAFSSLGINFLEVDSQDMAITFDGNRPNSTIVHYIASVNSNIPIPKKFQMRYI